MGNRATRLLTVLTLSILAAACGDDGGDSPDAFVCTPVNDNNECTMDTCRNNMAVHDPVTAGTPCAAGACNAAGMCVAPSCTDNMENGTETDVDCGGSCAPTSTCDTGEGCAVAGDCASGVCGAGMTCSAPACGDGVMQAGEMCDDGNMTNNDGCDDGTGGTCRPTGCGNGTVAGTEVCDDGNAVNGDGCDNNCTTSACGNGVTAGTETCDDGDAMGGDGCSATCATEAGFTCTMAVPSVCTGVCGDSMVVAGEACDDGDLTGGDGCSATCTVETGYTCTGAPSTCGPLCGDMMMIAPETCDDGNTASLDGCSSTCRTERTEVEPNEDGMTSSRDAGGIEGNDFDLGATSVAVMNANMNGAYQLSNGSGAFLGVIGVVGDEDVLAVTNNTSLPQTVRFDLWNRAPGSGFMMPCPDAQMFDTGLNIRDALGARVAFNDDRSSAADRCSGLSVNMAVGQTLYAHIVEYDDDLALPAPGYGMTIVPTPIVCGNGIATAGFEECDDGNTVDNDACNNMCLIAAAVNEVEPNNTNAEADANAVITGDALIRASIGSTTDVDVFRMNVTTAGVVRIESFVPAPNNCDASTTTIRLFTAAGVEITNDTIGSGIASCGAMVFPVTPGTFYIRHEESGVNAAITRYFLDVEFMVDAGMEAEPANMMGVNDTNATADGSLGLATNAFVRGDHTLIADTDVYAITVPPGMGVRAEIVEGDRAIETCESNGIDSRLTLFNGTTTLVDDDDGGRGFCSLVDGTGNTPRNSAARNNTMAPVVWHLHVRRSGTITSAAGQFIYQLQVTVR